MHNAYKYYFMYPADIFIYSIQDTNLPDNDANLEQFLVCRDLSSIPDCFYVSVGLSNCYQFRKLMLFIIRNKIQHVSTYR